MAVENNPILDVTRFKLSQSNILIVASDGVADPQSDAWLQALLGESSGDNCKELAGIILKQAMAHNGTRDDMTVLALRVYKKEGKSA